MAGVDVTEKQASVAARYRKQVTASTLWAAWADALGFITELTGASGLRHRTGGKQVTTTIDWTRRVGGQYGVVAQIPAGTYSDDTQLRLAVSRSIADYGFDVETFARIELTVWPSYALGGGRASRAAAAGMTKVNATWHTNFYDGWTRSGGNGAAMRIQPHVWAGGLDDNYIVPVLRDAIVTHGHPRALVGAVLHAVCLAFSLREMRTPTVDDWQALLRATRGAVRFFFDDLDLSDIWVSSWESVERRSFREAWDEAVDECDHLLRIGAGFARAATHANADVFPTYGDMVERMGLTDKKTLGSGTATVTAAMALAAVFDRRPADAALLAAHTLGTDTDTIATIAAAMIGAATGDDHLPGPVQDEGYLRAEADRLAKIAVHEPTSSFPYPDTLRWKPPQSQLEAVGIADGRLALAGIGFLDPIGPSFETRDAVWSWLQSTAGPSFLAKHRFELRELPRGNWPTPLRGGVDETLSRMRPRRVPDAVGRPGRSRDTLFDFAPEGLADAERLTPPLEAVAPDLNVRDLTDEALGQAVRRAARNGSNEDWATLTAYLRSQLRR